MLVPYCLDDGSFVVEFEVREHNIFSFALIFLKIDLAIQGLLCFHTDFRIICFSSFFFLQVALFTMPTLKVTELKLSGQ